LCSLHCLVASLQRILSASNSHPDHFTRACSHTTSIIISILTALEPVTRRESAQNPTKHRLIQTLFMVSPPNTRCSTDMSPSPSSSSLPAPHFGYVFLVASALLLAIGTHALLFSALFPGLTASGGRWPTNNTTVLLLPLDALARDSHYKYLALFSVPVCAYFVIANWVGWQFFRNS